MKFLLYQTDLYFFPMRTPQIGKGPCWRRTPQGEARELPKLDEEVDEDKAGAAFSEPLEGFVGPFGFGKLFDMYADIEKNLRYIHTCMYNSLSVFLCFFLSLSLFIYLYIYIYTLWIIIYIYILWIIITHAHTHTHCLQGMTWHYMTLHYTTLHTYILTWALEQDIHSLKALC